ncbi:MAG TPA: hypothetical protein VFY12_01090 [Arenimonas sp.]|nr:hypothetical protein [Arenimonas sp.]
MSARYRLLREDLPDFQASGQGLFETEPKKIRAWIESLPRANAAAAQQQLRQALESIAAQKLSGGSRLAALEELRAAVLEQCRLLENSYSTSPLPLPAEQARAASSAEIFHLLLAHSYRQAVHDLCAPSGSVPFLRGGAVAQALARSAQHYARSLALAWRIYHPARPKAWQGLHRIYRFAAELKLDGKAVEDPVLGLSGNRSVADTYLQCLLVAITNPYGYVPAEQDAMWSLVCAYFGRCGLHAKLPYDNAPVVPDDADHGPGMSRDDEAGSLWIDLRPFIGDVEQAQARLKDGFADLVPGRGASLRLSEDELVRLRRAFGLLAARRHARLPGGYGIDSVVGLSALHFYLSGQRDFETFLRETNQGQVHVNDRASWASGGGDAQRLPRIPAQVMDQSLGGYRVVWRSAEQARIRVGELVGLSFADPDEVPEWMVGIVRWLRYEIDGRLSAGIELLSRRSAPVALRAGTQVSNAPLRAVELSLAEGERRFLAPAALDGHAERIDVVLAGEPGKPDSVARQSIEHYRMTLNTGEYVLLQTAGAAA